MSQQQIFNFINGKFVPAKDATTIDNINPATGELICTIPRSKKEDVEEAVKAAKEAFKSWSSSSFETRAQYLEKIAAAISAKLDYLAKLESVDCGKPLSLAKRVDIPRAESNFKFFSGAIRHDFTECHEMSDHSINYTQRSPVGVCGLITPWNLPLYLLSWKVAPALAMGNTIVAKTSEMTPNTANALAEICNEVGLPPGVFNLVHGYGWEAGEAIVSHPDTPLISFTGGTVTGKTVASIAAPMFKKLSLELGGKNATVVFADIMNSNADEKENLFDRAVEGVCRAAFANQGQVCLCGSRILIEESIADVFIDALKKKAEQLVLGNPLDASTTFGCLISHQHRDKIETYVKYAREEKAEIILGGSRPTLETFLQHNPNATEEQKKLFQTYVDKGTFYLPTLIRSVSPNSRCVQEEIFGPVVVLQTFKNETDLMEHVNGTKYGLAGSLWTSSVTRAHRISRLWETGMVWVNTWLWRDLRVPFGGWKESGTGTEGGRYSLEFYSKTKNICIYQG